MDIEERLRLVETAEIDLGDWLACQRSAAGNRLPEDDARDRIVDLATKIRAARTA